MAVGNAGGVAVEVAANVLHQSRSRSRNNSNRGHSPLHVRNLNDHRGNRSSSSLPAKEGPASAAGSAGAGGREGAAAEPNLRVSRSRRR